MNEQRTNNDVEQALTQWAEQVAPKSPPTQLLESTFVRTMGTQQAGVHPWNKLPPRRQALSFSRSGAGLGIVVVALLLVLVVASSLIFGGRGPTATPSPSPSPGPSPTVSPEPTINASPTVVPLPSAISVVGEGSVAVTAPLAMVTDGQLLWVLASDGHIDTIDPNAGKIVDSVATGPPTDLYNGLAYSPLGLWATDADSAAVYRADAKPLKLVATVPAGSSPKGVLADSRGIWVADVHGGAVLRIDPATNKVADTVTVGPVGPSGPNWLAEGLGSIWVTVPNEAQIVRFDPATQAVQARIDALPRFTPCGGMVIANNAAWVTSCSSGTYIVRADATSNSITAYIDMHGYGFNPALINGSVWVSADGGDEKSGELLRIDATTNTIDRVLIPSTTFGGGGDICVVGDSVWVTDGYNNSVVRLPMTAFTD